MRMERQFFKTHKVIRLQYWSQVALLRLENKDKVLSGVGYLSFCSCNSSLKLSGDVNFNNHACYHGCNDDVVAKVRGI